MSVKKTDVFPSAFRVAPLLYYLFSRAARFPCVLPCILPRKADMEISFITFSLSPQGGCTGQITAVNRTVEYRNADRPFWVVHSVRICRKSRFTAVKLFVPTLKLYGKHLYNVLDQRVFSVCQSINYKSLSIVNS